MDSEVHVPKLLLVWAISVPDTIKILFSTVFVNVSDLLRYVWANVTSNETFRCIIPLDGLKKLIEDPAYKLPQVARIDVYSDNRKHLQKMQRYFNSKSKKLYFSSTYNLLRELESVMCNKALVSSNKVDRNAISTIISAIENRLSDKQRSISDRRSEILKEFSNTFLYGLPVKNITNSPLHFTCSSCELVCEVLRKLKCSHQHCRLCVSIRYR